MLDLIDSVIPVQTDIFLLLQHTQITFYLYDIATSGTTVHVLVIFWHLNAIDNAFQLSKVAVGGCDLSCLNTELPHSESQAGGRESMIKSKS